MIAWTLYLGLVGIDIISFCLIQKSQNFFEYDTKPYFYDKSIWWLIFYLFKIHNMKLGSSIHLKSQFHKYFWIFCSYLFYSTLVNCLDKNIDNQDINVNFRISISIFQSLVHHCLSIFVEQE